MPIRQQNTGGTEIAYRAYEIGDDERVRTFTVVEADSEEDAIEQARRLVDGHAIELWDRGRKIVRFDPQKG